MEPTLDPNDPANIRAQLMASLQQRMAPVAAPDTSALDAQAAKDKQDALTYRAGTQLGQAFLGKSGNGDNLASTQLEGDAQTQLAKAVEQKRLAQAADDRREQLRNGLSTRFVDADNQAASDKTKAANTAAEKRLEATDTLTRDRANHKDKLAEIAALNAGKVEAVQAKGAGPAKGLSDKNIDKVASFDDGLHLLDTIGEMSKGQETGPGYNLQGNAAELVGMNDPQKSGFRQMVNTNLAAYIAEISGKAVSDAERKFLTANTPSTSDNPATFQTKLKNVKDYTLSKQANYRSALDASGKDTSKLKPVGGAAKPAVQKVDNPDDQAAIDWANAHPDDPRAAKILKLHGG